MTHVSPLFVAWSLTGAGALYKATKVGHKLLIRSVRSVSIDRASRTHVSARFKQINNTKMLFFITVSVLVVSANAKFYTDCGNYCFFVVFSFIRFGYCYVIWSRNYALLLNCVQCVALRWSCAKCIVVRCKCNRYPKRETCAILPVKMSYIGELLGLSTWN